MTPDVNGESTGPTEAEVEAAYKRLGGEGRSGLVQILDDHAKAVLEMYYRRMESQLGEAIARVEQELPARANRIDIAFRVLAIPHTDLDGIRAQAIAVISASLPPVGGEADPRNSDLL